MARVERRVYRRRRKRRRILLTMFIILAAAAAAIWFASGKGRLLAERLNAPTPTPVTAAYDRTVQTREVTLPEAARYAIQTGVFSTEEAAMEKADDYTDRGAPGVVIQDGAKWRVFIACYRNEAEASAVRTKLGEMQRVETYLYRWLCPELRLRLTGMAGQLDAVEAGLTLMMQLPDDLMILAVQLDAAQLTEAEVRTELTSLRKQADLWKRTAKDRFGLNIPALVQQLLDAAEGFDRRAEEILGADTVTALSAALKLRGMQGYDELIRLRAGIGTE